MVRQRGGAAGLVAALVVVVVCLVGCAEVAEPSGNSQPAPVVEGPVVTGGREYPILVYFTDPQYPDNPADHQGGLDRTLAADIAQAKASVDVAIYRFGLESVANALLDANDAGVRVRLVIEADFSEEPEVQRLKSAGINVVEDGQESLMHDKFVVIDEAIVWTGSWNLTDSGTYRNNNNTVRIVSEQLAENYTVEFEEMYAGRAFGASSPANTPHPEVLVGSSDRHEGIRVESYFAPEDQVAEKLLALIGQAEESIRFMAFILTDDRLGEAIMQQHEKGLTVQGVFEERNADLAYSEFGRMYGVEPRMDVRLDGNTYMMHHKVIILDDETVILGSFNFSRSADERNDENVLVIHDGDVARQYRAEFRKIYREGAEGRE